MTDTLIEPTTTAPPQTQPGSGDHDKFRHFWDKNELTEALVFQTPIRALCGIVKVPEGSRKDLEVCPECKDIWEGIPPRDDADKAYDGNLT